MQTQTSLFQITLSLACSFWDLRPARILNERETGEREREKVCVCVYVCKERGARYTVSCLIRIPVRRDDKSPPPKFARILAFALLVFASREHWRERLHPHSHSASLSFVFLDSARSDDAHSPAEQLFPLAGDGALWKRAPRHSSVSPFRFLYSSIRLFMRPYI